MVTLYNVWQGKVDIGLVSQYKRLFYMPNSIKSRFATRASQSMHA